MKSVLWWGRNGLMRGKREYASKGEGEHQRSDGEAYMSGKRAREDIEQSGVNMMDEHCLIMGCQK